MKFYIFLFLFLFYACIDQVESEQNDFVQLVQQIDTYGEAMDLDITCLLYTSPSPRD